MATHSLTAQPGDEVADGEGKVRTPTALLNAVDSLLQDFEVLGLDRSQIRLVKSRASIMTSCRHACERENALIPPNLSKVLSKVANVDNDATASLLLCDSLSKHLSQLHQTDAEVLKTAAVDFIRTNLEDPANKGKKALAEIAVDLISTTFGQGKAEHGQSLLATISVLPPAP